MKFLKLLGTAVLFMASLMPIAAQQPQTHTDPPFATNSNWVNGVAPGYAPTIGSGLTLDLGGGTSDCNNTIVEYAGGTLSLANNTTNYVYLNTGSSCAPTSNTSGFTSNYLPIAVVVTSGGAITSVDDVRTYFSYRPGSAGSGTQVSLNSGAAQSSLAVTGFMPQTCIDTTGNDLDQSCTTANTFVPQNGNCFVYYTAVTNNSPSFNISINGSSNIPVAMPSANGFTTTLNDFSFPTSTPVMMCYDGVNLNASPSGTTPGGFLTGYQVTKSGLLTIEVAAGNVNCAGSLVNSPQQQFTLTPSSNNYVFLDTSASCALTVNTTGFGINNIPISLITTTLAISSIQDQRTLFAYNPALSFPGAGVANSTGTGWGTSYQVGISANDLVQLNGSAQLPALNGSLLTNLAFMSLSTIGTTGPASLSSGVLNIPNYSGGGGGGNIPSNAIFAFVPTSSSDDDNHVLSSAVALTSWSTSGSTTTVINTGTNNFSAGQWVSMRFATSFPGSPHGFQFYKVLSAGLTSTHFELDTTGVSAGTCASTCGSAYSATPYLPFSTTGAPGMPTAAATSNTYAFCAGNDPSGNPCTLYGMETNYSTILHSISPAVTGQPGYLIVFSPNNDLGLGYTLANIKTYYQALFSAAHADGWTIVVSSPTGANFNQSSAPSAFANQIALDEWLRGQGKSTVQAASPGSAQYWDIWTDVGNTLWDGSNTDMIAANTGLGPTGAKLAGITIASDMENANGRPLQQRTLWWAGPVGGGSTGNNGYVFTVGPAGVPTAAWRWMDFGLANTYAELSTSGVLSAGQIWAGSIHAGSCPGGRPFCTSGGLNIDNTNNIWSVAGIVAASGPSNANCWNTNGGVITGCGGAAVWGSITGTLSSQTDLQTALNAKAPTASPTFTGTPDASGATQFKLPVAGGGASAANGEIIYDSTNKNWHLWVNGADEILAPLATGFTSGHCGQPTLTGGSWSIADAGGACGTSGGTGTVQDGAGTSTPLQFPESTSTPHVLQYRTPSQALGDMGAAPALACTTVSSLSPANNGCYNLSTSSSTAMPAASAFTIFKITTQSGETATLTGTTLTANAGCSSYLSGTTLALTGNQSIIVQSDGTNIWATCTFTSSGGAWTQIQSQTVSGTPGSMTFSSIPGGYNSLNLRCILTDSSGLNNANLTFNGDTTAGHYWWTSVYVDPATTPSKGGSASDSKIGGPEVNASPDASQAVFDIVGYALTSVNKTVYISNPSPFTGGSTMTGLDIYGAWKSTAAITSLTLTMSSSTLSGGVCTLYGIN